MTAPCYCHYRRVWIDTCCSPSCVHFASLIDDIPVERSNYWYCREPCQCFIVLSLRTFLLQGVRYLQVEIRSELTSPLKYSLMNASEMFYTFEQDWNHSWTVGLQSERMDWLASSTSWHLGGMTSGGLLFWSQADACEAAPRWTEDFPFAIASPAHDSRLNR